MMRGVLDPEIAAVRERLRTDLPFFARHCLTVLTEDKRPVRLEARPWQARTPLTPSHVTPLDEALEAQRANGQPQRAIILKARKLGMSTWMQAKMFQRVALHPFQYALTVAHTRGAAAVLYDMASLMWERMPNERELSELIYGVGSERPPPFDFKPRRLNKGESRNGARWMVLGDPMRRVEASIYETLTAGAKGGGRASTPSILHGSEVAQYEDPEYLVGLLNAVPKTPESVVVLESTARGFNHFYDRWVRAVEGAEDPETGGLYVPLFYGWQDSPFNSLPFVSDGARARFETAIGDPDGGGDEEELMLAETFGVSLEQLRWRRVTIAEECGGDVEFFHQEHPACLTAETRVSTNLGIVSIVEAARAVETESGPILRWGPQPASTIYKLTTKQGRVLRGTHDHPVETDAGLVGLSQLESGTKIELRAPRFADHPFVECWDGPLGSKSHIVMTGELARWIGYFMGDGSWHAGTVDFALDAKDPDVVDDVARLTMGFFGRVPGRREISRVRGRKGMTNLRVGCAAARPLLHRLGLIGTNGSGAWRREVCVPECIWRSPRGVVREFLRGLFECDGSASQGFARFASSKEQFARDVQLLLLGFGLNAVMHRQTRPAGSGHMYTFFTLQLGGDAARAFHDEIGFIGERKRALRPEKPTSNRGRGCVGTVLWDEVETVEEDGFEITYDFTMDTDEHLFMAGGIVTHNTPEQAFIGSGRPVFPGILVAKMIKAAESAPAPVEGVLRGDEWKIHKTRSGTVKVPQRALWVPRDQVTRDDIDRWGSLGRLAVWEHPINAETQEGIAPAKVKSDGQYVVFADVAIGSGGTMGDGDWHAVQVLDHVARVQVARFRSRIPVHDLPILLYLIALYYNTAWLAPEVNGPGQGVIDALRNDLRYPLLYRRRTRGDDDRTDAAGHLLGWQTTLQSKPLMEQTFGQALREGSHGLRCVLTGREATTYVEDPKNAAKHGAQKGAYDDLLMAFMGAHRVAAELRPREPGKTRRVRGRDVVDPLTGY
jgi:hypothetical protein